MDSCSFALNPRRSAIHHLLLGRRLPGRQVLLELRPHEGDLLRQAESVLGAGEGTLARAEDAIPLADRLPPLLPEAALLHLHEDLVGGEENLVGPFLAESGRGLVEPDPVAIVARGL